MRYQSTMACAALITALLSTPGFAASGKQRDAGMDALLELLSAKGVITSEEGAALREKSGGSATAGIKAMLELLQSKGSVSKEEAEKILKAAQGPAPRAVQAGETGEQQANEAPAGQEPAVAGKIAEEKLPEKEVRPVVEVLREQGVLGIDEAEQLKERIGTEWTPSEDDDFIAHDELDIEYSRTTLPKEALLGDITKLRHQGVITDQEAERVRKRFLQKLALERVTESIGVSMKNDMSTEVASRIIPIPDWTQRVKLGGDLRLRYRADLFDKNNGPFFKPDQSDVNPLGNSTIDRNYAQVRARFNLNFKISDDVTGVFGFATGNTTNPVSTNTTLGDSLNKKSILLDLAYLKWTPQPELTVWGGRFPNPWFGSDLVWDPDINFDGLAMSWKPAITSNLNMFFTTGAFPIQEFEPSGRDRWLFGGQVGANYTWRDKLAATFGAAYYHYLNIPGIKNGSGGTKGATDWSRLGFMQKGNTVFYLDADENLTQVTTAGYTGWNGYKGIAADFGELNMSLKLDYNIMGPYHVVFTGDYVNNIAYNSADVDARVGAKIKKATEGYQVGLAVGHPETTDAWMWKLMVNYKYLEPDAVLDAYTESDFHLGGTNAKGWILGADLGLYKNVWLNTRWFTANEVTGIPFSVDVFQLNLNARF